MKSIFVTLASVFFSFAVHAAPQHDPNAGHLSFAQGTIHCHLTWLQGPLTSGESKMQLEWHNAATHEIFDPGLPFSVALFMPSMGHGSAPTKIQPAHDPQGSVIPGVYEVSNMHFMMAGDWEVRVTLKDSSGNSETQAWALMVAPH